jgi:hypothetical protein
MNGPSRAKRWVARTLPGVLLVATLIDDPVFGGVIVAARLAFGTVGVLAASGAFVVLSVAMAAATAWALHTEPLQLSTKTRNRITSLQQRRLGRHLIPHPNRPLSTALAAVIFGSVAPTLVAALDQDTATSMSNKMALICGIAYGLAFAAGYGLLGAVIGGTAT